MNNLWQMILIFINFQWQDRKKTSSFMVGITLQTLVLSLAVVGVSETAEEAFKNSLRAYFFTSVNIIVFAAMANFSNEFRFGTIASIIISKTSVSRLILYRSLATAAVSSPALLIPLFLSSWRFSAVVNLQGAAGVAMALGFAVVLCYFSSYVLNLFPNPNSVVPWLRYYFLVLGLGVIPGTQGLANFLPMAWSYRAAENGMDFYVFGAYLLTLAPYILIPMIIINPRVVQRIEYQLAKGSVRI